MGANMRKTDLVINLGAIKHNIKAQLSALPNGGRVLAVVKANAYGHGLIPVAHAAIEAGASGCCVALLDEAIRLRKAGITKTILVLGITPVEYGLIAAENNISLSVGDEEWLANYQALASEVRNVPPLKVHLAVDTGMGRIGFRQLTPFKHAIERLKADCFEFEGAFTHFATADADDENSQSHYDQQVKRWQTFVKALVEMDAHPKYIHAANSAVGMWHPRHATMNTIRMGISMYGVDPSQLAIKPTLHLKPAMSLVSTLTFVKEIEPGEPVGYGATYHAESKEWIGTIPVGYADGYRRALQGGHVIIDGHYCEIVGRICMDQMMVRLPKKEAVGTPVILLGRSGQLTVTIDDLAQRCGTINYEILTGFSDRLNRRYVDDD